MKKRYRNVALLILAGIVYMPVFAPAAENIDSVASTEDMQRPYLLRRGDNELGFWAGYSPKAITNFGGLYGGEAESRQYFIASFRYGRTLAANNFFALQYIADASPLNLATGVIVERTTDGGKTVFQRETAYGIGITPVGVQLDFANGSKIHPFLYANGGITLFNKSMPTEFSGDFTFIGHGGGGIRVFTSDRRALTLGLQIHHISNAGLESTNRGLNQFIFYVGFSFFK